MFEEIEFYLVVGLKCKLHLVWLTGVGMSVSVQCVFLSHGVYVANATWWAATEDRGTSRILMAGGPMGQGTSGRLGGRTIGRSGDAVCDPHSTHGGDPRVPFGQSVLKSGQSVL